MRQGALVNQTFLNRSTQIPLYARRNIFDVMDNRPTLAIVFGRLGYSEITETWEAFRPDLKKGIRTYVSGTAQ